MDNQLAKHCSTQAQINAEFSWNIHQEDSTGRIFVAAHYIIANSFDWSISVGYIGAYCTFL